MNCNILIYNDDNCNTIVHDNRFDENYIYVYVLLLNQTTGITSDYFVKTEEDLKVIFNLGIDGFYTLITLQVPKGEGFEYYYNNGNFYHYYDIIDLKTLIELNPTITNLETDYNYYFLTCNLRKCYINSCYEIFDSTASINCNKSNLDKNIIYKRNLLLSTLNVIEFMVERSLFEEAERLLERVMGCNGICNNLLNKYYNIQEGHYNCGCK